jgi:hypothetical protein
MPSAHLGRAAYVVYVQPVDEIISAYGVPLRTS